MNPHEKYKLTPVINAHGTYTPLGVSRSSAAVARAVSDALGRFFIIDELQDALSEAVARATGAEAAALTHCVAAGISLSVAAAMAGAHPQRVAALPDASGMARGVVIPATHTVDYGHPILTDIRLTGARPVLAGESERCTLDDIETALAQDDIACLLLVSSRLVRGDALDLQAAVALAHRRGVPAIIDGAAQDMRIAALLATGADLVLVSPHKYMASPTAGLIVGRRALVQACRVHERGIGRAMKATKEALVGVLAALEERNALDPAAWQAEQERKLQWFLQRADSLAHIEASAWPDPSGMPFSRVRLQIGPDHPAGDAGALARALREGAPSIWVMAHACAEGVLALELVSLAESEMERIIERLAELGGRVGQA